MGAHGRIRRQYYGWPVVGSYYRRISGLGPQSFSSSHIHNRDCADTVGNYPNPNGLSSQLFTSGPAILSGSSYVSLGGVMVLDKQYITCPATYKLTALSTPFTVPDAIETNSLVTQGMAATNPSAPTMSVPTFLGELKDLPGLVRTWIKRLLNWRRSRRIFDDPLTQEDLAKGFSEGWITWKWVIAPAVRDLTAILEFQKAATKRFELLQKLRDERLISGHGPSSAITSTSSATKIIESRLGDLVFANERIYSTRRVWSSVQWSTTSTGPNAANLPSSDEELYALSERLVRGITGYESLATAWELLPWSWFFDWFADIGATIKAANNTVHAEPGNMCVMCTRQTTATYVITSKPSWLEVDTSGFMAQLTDKWRTVVPTVIPFAAARLPYLNASHWSILASLATLKYRSR